MSNLLNRLLELADVPQISPTSIPLMEFLDDIKKGDFHKWLGKSEDEAITQADIDKGLASSDPHARKMAQFAKNSEEWNHKEDIESDSSDTISESENITFSCDGKPDRTLTKEAAERMLRSKFDDNQVDLFLMNIMAGKPMAITIKGVQVVARLAQDVNLRTPEEVAEGLIEENRASEMIAKVNKGEAPAPAGNLDSTYVPVEVQALGDAEKVNALQDAKMVDNKVPSDVIDHANKRIAELKASIAKYNDKGYNDGGVKRNAVDALEQLVDNLSKGDDDGYMAAQIYLGTLMSPITGLFPPKLINHLANRGHTSHEFKPVKETVDELVNSQVLEEDNEMSEWTVTHDGKSMTCKAKNAEDAKKQGIDVKGLSVPMSKWKDVKVTKKEVVKEATVKTCSECDKSVKMDGKVCPACAKSAKTTETGSKESLVNYIDNDN